MNKDLLMDKVIEGSASPDEQREFDAWLTESEENLREFEDVKFLIENADHTEREPDDPFYDDWHKIKKRIDAMQKRNRILRAILIAVALIAILGFLYFVFHQMGVFTSSRQDWSVTDEESCLKNNTHTLAVRYSIANASDS